MPAKQEPAKWQGVVDTLFKVGTPLGLALVAWMGSKFATRAELQALQGQVSEIEKVIAVIVEQNKVNQRQDDTLADHEERLRALEKK